MVVFASAPLGKFGRIQSCALYLPDYMMSSQVRPKALGNAGLTLHSRCQSQPPRTWRLQTLSRSPLFEGPPLLERDGGARRDRTDDLMLAKHALYQLSYGPKTGAAAGELVA